MNRIAIIIPGYNCAKHIQKCLDSILSQEYIDYTIFFIDDGSVDSTRNIVSAIEDKHLKYIYQTNAGVSAARNKGLLLARNFEYIMFVDSDDWLEKKALAAIADSINRSDNADFILFDWNEYRIREGKKERVHCKMKEGFTERFSLDCLLNHLARSRSGGSPWGKLYKNSIITKYGLKFVEELPYAEDYLFNIAFLQKAGSVYYCPIAVYGYNCCQTGARAKFRKNLMDIFIRIEEEKRQLFSINNNIYYDMLIAEQLEQCTIALLNLRNSSFSPKERKTERDKARAYLKAENINFMGIIRSKANTKVKLYIIMILYGTVS